MLAAQQDATVWLRAVLLLLLGAAFYAWPAWLPAANPDSPARAG